MKKILFSFRLDQNRPGNVLTLGYEDSKYVDGQIGGKAREINLYVPPNTTVPELVEFMKQGIEKLNADLAKNL